VFTSAGMWMEQVALNWLVYDLTGSAVQLGILNGFRALPSLVTGLFGGVAADRVDRKRLMIVTQWLLLALYLALGLIIVAGMVQVWHLMVFTLASGVVWTFNQPVRQAILPNLVPPEDRVNAIALQSAAFNVTRVMGPAAGGILIALAGAGGAILAEAATWVGVLVATYMMRVPPNPPRTAQASSMWRDLSDGISYIARTPDVRALILMAMLPFVVIMPYMTLLTVFAKDIFHMDAAGLGVLMSVSGIGALAATLAVASLGSYRGKGKLLIGSAFAMSFALIGFALSSWLPLAYVMLILVSAASMGYMALSNTMLNLIIPNELRGRVMSVYMLDRGLMPLGSLFAGAVAAAWSAPAALALMGIAGLAISVMFVTCFPVIRRLD
jgi:MFS family permease